MAWSISSSATSILVCHFILNLRRVERSHMHQSEPGTLSDGLQFAMQSGTTLPHFVASFAQPVHVGSFETEVNMTSGSSMELESSKGV
ncbi:hypothetical protein BD309DRAFT_355694 [Dichomitus squalens]|uniref:Uncharacterized protein n=1 Tax=Dichomitus squalens TaxID=114155 RepID=A0A4V2K6Z8_9APHY|nr:hypothetical protein BD309DRAFT_355694 [Dichomitus squalens]TBU54108.1 hypothetical protein BD310DRAFT_969962 [Dichomitus squalens]